MKRKTYEMIGQRTLDFRRQDGTIVQVPGWFFDMSEAPIKRMITRRRITKSEKAIAAADK